MVCREYVMAGRMHVGEMDVLPVVEIRVDVGTVYTVQSCIAQARPIGFAILLPEGGYWLVHPQDLSLLADAVQAITSSEVRAS